MTIPHHKQPRDSMGPRGQAVHGVIPGSTDHRILLALRGVGGMTSDQIFARFGAYQGGGLTRLKNAGLITTPAIGKKGESITLTTLGRELTEYAGPLSRRHLITYCQL